MAYSQLVALDARTGTLRDEFTPTTIAWYLVAFVAFLMAIWWNHRHPIPMVWLWAVPIVFRLLMLATTPTLSDDVYRYLWDGHVATSGVNPYAYTLDAPALDALHIPARDLANNPDLGTPYLPVAQLVFATGALAAPSVPLTLQVVMVGFDLATALVIVRLLRLSVQPERRVMLYLWNPLVVTEIAHGAHLESAMVFLAMLAVYLSLSSSRFAGAAPLVLALATLTKPLPVLLLPFLWPRWRRSGQVLYGATLATVLVPFGVSAGWGLVGPETGTGLFGSARVFSSWAFNGGVAFWLEGWLDGASSGVLSFGDPALVTRFVVGAVMVIGLVWAAMIARRRESLAGQPRVMAIPMMIFVVLTPTLYPWYLLIVVAFLPFVLEDWPRGGWVPIVPWLYLGATVVFSYLTYLDPNNHHEIEWVRRLEWIPTLVLIAVAAAVTRWGHRVGTDEGSVESRTA